MVPSKVGKGSDPAGAAPADDEESVGDDEGAAAPLLLQARHGCMTIDQDANARTLTDTSSAPR